MNGKIKPVIAILVLGAVVAVAAILLLRDVPSKSAVENVATRAPVPSSENVSQSIRDQVTHLRLVVEKDPGNSKALFDLARLLQDSHNAREAAMYYERGLKIDNANSSARIDYALCLSELGKMSEAMAESRLVLRDSPGNPHALFNIGALHANNGANDSAVTYWETLIRLHPEDALAARAGDNLKSLRGHSGMSR